LLKAAGKVSGRFFIAKFDISKTEIDFQLAKFAFMLFPANVNCRKYMYIHMKRWNWSAVSLVTLLAVAPAADTTAQIWKKILPEKKEVAKNNDAASEETVKQLRADIGYLASDQLEGRRTGTKGEALAGMYIEKRMANIGLMPFGTTYRRPFKFEWGKELTPEIRLTIAGKYVSVPEDAFPAAFSAAGKDDNYVLPESTESNSPWLISLYETEQDANNPHFDWEKETFNRARKAFERGATSVLFYDKFGSKYAPKYTKRTDYENLEIPVLILGKKVYDQYIKDMKVMQPVFMNITFRKEFRSGTNIVGYINNNAAYTAIIGAHYDHLGYGEDGNSRSVDGVKMIHNGADDNASGVAAMLALAGKLKQAQYKKYNYLFIAFSAEELGLLGSKAFVKEKDFNKNKAAYMLNMDMVGRLGPDRKLTVGGIGTSPVWSSVMTSVPSNFKISKDSSGVGPSDHSSFYNDSIPVLFFFTGTHMDYHKPTDDASKINYSGTKDVVNYVYGIVGAMEKQPVPLFATTKNSSMGSRTAFKVTLGIMPDYSYQEIGVRVDGVMDGKPAFKAGLKAGDIVLQLGDKKINGMQTYMEALGSFNPGDKTVVKVKRGVTVQEFNLVF
jgi:aminopeptidase YwaD